MNPIGHGIFKSLRDRRVCPHCRKEQVVAAKSKGKPATCKACGKSIPPPRAR
jgi:ribosomal protein S27E